MSTLDLREIPPPQRHPLVYQHLDALRPGESLELTNDHRPSPLRYEIEATRPDEFEWTDGLAGPDVFTATITCRARIVDARPIIERGEEPFATIMDAVAEVGPGETLVVLAPFEPVPLEGVLSSQGFTYEAAQLPTGDWRVAFRSTG
ncbi:MAG: DUF2249 domain-containing protein [Acidimicrobiia bacterium]